jgi:hypothetical protein
MPQLALQQSCPAAQVLGPQAVVPVAGGGGADAHSCWVQKPPGETQMPQLELQHSSPAAQVFGPQLTPGVTAELEEAIGPGAAGASGP